MPAAAGIYNGTDPSIAPQAFIGDMINKGLKVILYTGLLDAVVPHPLTEMAIRDMKWKGQKGFKRSQMTKADMTPIKIGKDTVGRYHSENGLSYVVFNEAGHMVPRDVSICSLYFGIGSIVISMNFH